jgi:hypothetical protein
MRRGRARMTESWSTRNQVAIVTSSSEPMNASGKMY